MFNAGGALMQNENKDLTIEYLYQQLGNMLEAGLGNAKIYIGDDSIKESEVNFIFNEADPKIEIETEFYLKFLANLDDARYDLYEDINKSTMKFARKISKSIL